MAKVTLGGHTVYNAPAWMEKAGVGHQQAEFEVSSSAASSLTAGSLSAPVTLTFDSPGAKGVTISNLYVLQRRPGSDPNRSMVSVVDRRWFWPRKHVNHVFNMRRTVGIKRVKAGFEQPVLDPLEPKIRYASFSLKDRAYIWTPRTALEEIWKTIQESEKDQTGSAPSLVIEGDIGKLTEKALPLEDVMLADDGKAAFQRILNFIPGAEVTLDHDGTVRVYSIASGSEAAVMDAMLPEQDGGGHAMPISNARIRPSEVRVFFAPEAEMRFNASEIGTGGTDPPPGKEEPFMDNVLPIPDYSLKVGGITMAQGTYITISEALQAWAAEPGGLRLTTETIRRAMVPGMDLWVGLGIAGLGADRAAWGPRIAAIQQHYRRSYRINQRVIRSCRSIRAYRTATINPQTGSRAPATAFQDWAVVATPRFLAVQLGGGATDLAYAQNFDKGYPDGGNIGTDSASPIEVTVVDSDQGIISLDLKPGQFRINEQFLPSLVENIPTGKLKFGLFSWNSIESGQAAPTLSATHKVIVILTVVPASPNSKSRLFQMTRKASDVKELLPSSLQSGIANANGPPIDVFIGPGWEVARIAWVDKQGGRIKQALGFSDVAKKGGLGVKDPAGVSSLGDLIVNLGSQKSIGNSAASMDAIANSVAASVYAGFSDRMEGSRTHPVTHAARVTGFIESVLHKVLPTGEATSTVSIMSQKSPFSILSMMDSATRAQLLKLATSAKAVN